MQLQADRWRLEREKKKHLEGCAAQWNNTKGAPHKSNSRPNILHFDMQQTTDAKQLPNIVIWMMWYKLAWNEMGISIATRNKPTLKFDDITETQL